MATEIRTLAQNTHEVHEKMIALDGSVAKSHWRHDDADKKVIDLKDEIVRIAETDQTQEDKKKKAIWATIGLSAGGAFAGNKIANFFAALFTP
jgi:hypothetical protein